MARNSDKREKQEMHTVGPGKWYKNWKTFKMRHKNCLTWNTARNTQKHGNWEMHTVGPGLWRENCKTWKMSNSHVSSTWNMQRNIEKCAKWEIHTVGPGIGKKQWKMWKINNTQYRTRVTARKLKYVETETETLYEL